MISPNNLNIVDINQDHELHCIITDILSTATVSWTTGTSGVDISSAFVQGERHKSKQKSTLTLTSTILAQLHAAATSNAAHQFTCQITVNGAAVTATGAVNIDQNVPGLWIFIIAYVIGNSYQH